MGCGHPANGATGSGWVTPRREFDQSMGGSAVTDPWWDTEGVDLDRPSAARMYDFYLGGFHNFSIDRKLAQQAIQEWPELPLIMTANRAFLRRTVSHLVERGMRQFLDLGSGIPTVGNVHEVAQGLVPECRVVYVDIDPVAVAHSRSILADNACATALLGDLRRPGEVMNAAIETGLIDPAEPTAVLLLAVLHFVSDEDEPAAAIAALRDRLAPGSHIALSHATHELHPEELTSSHRALYRQTATPMTMRTYAEVCAMFDGLDVLDPGVVLIERWSPSGVQDVDNPERTPAWGGIGLKP